MNALGDFNGDGSLTVADLQGELTLLTSGGSGSASTVPEPKSILLLASALIFTLIAPISFRKHALPSKISV